MIKYFRGDKEFLSNFYPSPILVAYHNLVAPTAEHAFQSMKTYDKKEAKRIISAGTPSEAKRIGRSVNLRDNWEDVKIQVMYKVIREKFKKNDKLGNMLVNTHRHTLIEGNTWHDNYWGDCQCEKCINIKGKNILGKILMGVRFEMIVVSRLNFNMEYFVVESNHRCVLCNKSNCRCVVCNNGDPYESVHICFHCINKINEAYVELSKQDTFRE